MIAPGSFIVYNSAVEDYRFGPEHPFRLDRGKLFLEKAQLYGLIGDAQVITAHPGTDQDLLTFHTREYVKVLNEANSGEHDFRFLEYGLGPGDNPIFQGVHNLSLIFAGFATKASELVLKPEVEKVFVPVGGFHHAWPGRAGGFCYINDLGIAIEGLLTKGLRVLYIDIDAHHGDGVQAGFYDTDQVMKISFHETGRSLFPGSGFETETGIGPGEGLNINIPLHPSTDDQVFLKQFKRIFPVLASKYKADITIAQIGVDAMNSDPLTHLKCTNNMYIEAIQIIGDYSKKLIAFGGGGYHPDNIAKDYTLAWAVMNNYDVETEAAHLMLGGTFLSSSELLSLGALRDMNLYVSGPEKEAALRDAERVYDYIKEHVFRKIKC